MGDIRLSEITYSGDDLRLISETFAAMKEKRGVLFYDTLLGNKILLCSRGIFDGRSRKEYKKLSKNNAEIYRKIIPEEVIE